MARALCEETFGGLTFVQALGSLVATVLDFQVGRRVLRDVSAPGADVDRTMSSFVTLRGLMGLVAGGLCLAIAVAGPYSDAVVTGMATMVPVIVFASIWNGLFLYFQYRLRLTAVAVTLVATRILSAGLLLLLVARGVDSIALYIAPAIVLEASTLVVLVVLCRREVRLRPVVDWARWGHWLREAVPIAFGAAIGLIYYRLDIVMLAVIDDLEATAQYGVAYKFTELIGFVPSAFMAATFPLLVLAWPDDVASFGRNVRGVLVLLLGAGAIFVGAFLVFSSDVVVFLYGDRYGSASTASTVVVIGEALRFVASVFVQVLIAVGRNRAYAVVALIGLGVNFGLNLLLIPRFSFEGAAVASVITQLAVVLVLLPMISRLPGVSMPGWPFVRILLALAAQVGVGLVLLPLVPWPVAGAAGAAAFLAVLHVVGVDGPGGLRVLRRLILAPSS